jgi:hypothetical protein
METTFGAGAPGLSGYCRGNLRGSLPVAGSQTHGSTSRITSRGLQKEDHARGAFDASRRLLQSSIGNVGYRTDIQIVHRIVSVRQERMQVKNPASMQWTPMTGTTVCASA